MTAIKAIFFTLIVAFSVHAEQADSFWNPVQKEQIERLSKNLDKQGRWFTVKSKYWTVYSDVSPLFATETAYYLDAYVDSLRQASPFPNIMNFPGEESPKVWIYSDPHKYQLTIGYKSTGHASWEYEDDEIVNMSIKTAAFEKDDLRFPTFNHHVLRHEAIHLMLQCAVGPESQPSWFHEAHASFFEVWDPFESTETNRQNTAIRVHGYETMMKAASAGKFPDIREVMKLRHTGTTWRDNGGEGTHINYAASASLMDALLQEEDLSEIYAQMFQRAIDGRSVLLDQNELRIVQAAWNKRLVKLAGQYTPSDPK